MSDFDVVPSPDSTRRASVPVRIISLADGQQWGLALPTPRYRPEIVPGVDELGRPAETIRVVGRVGYPLPIERLVDDLRSACRVEADSEGRRFGALMALAVALLRRAHDLTLLEAVELLDLDVDGLRRLVDAVLATVAGDPTRPFNESVCSTGGDDARPSCS